MKYFWFFLKMTMGLACLTGAITLQFRTHHPDLSMEVINSFSALSIYLGAQGFSWVLSGIHELMQARHYRARVGLQIMRGLIYLAPIINAILNWELSIFAMPLIFAGLFGLHSLISNLQTAQRIPEDFRHLQHRARDIRAANPNRIDVDPENPDPDLVNELYLEFVINRFRMMNVVSNERGEEITRELRKAEQQFEITAQQLLDGKIPANKIREKLEAMEFEQLIDLLGITQNPVHEAKTKEFKQFMSSNDYKCPLSMVLMKEPVLLIDGAARIYVDLVALRQYPNLKHPYTNNPIDMNKLLIDQTLKSEIQLFHRKVIDYIEQDVLSSRQEKDSSINNNNNIEQDVFSSPTSMSMYLVRRRIAQTNSANEISEPEVSNENQTSNTAYQV